MDEWYDIVVVGAGIQGVAVADEAGRRGKRVLVLEQFDQPAQGTSSKSSKLIHGGLRYLESFQFRLVYECLSERSRLLRKYPDLVRLQKFYIPIYKDTSRSGLMIRLGLSLYAGLAGFRKDNRFRKLSRAEWGGLDGLSSEGLHAVYQYYDAQTDDALLTRRVLEESGADVCYQAVLESCRREDGRLLVDYSSDGQLRQVAARWLVNAAGPWVNHVADRCHPQPDKLEVDLVQGAHIELPGQLSQGCYYMEAPQDRRAVFAIPWRGHIMIGTTETIFDGNPSDCCATNQEIDYLLEVYNHYFPNRRMALDDVITSWAGLRVLPRTESSPFGRSRDTFLVPDDANDPMVYAIYGGKLTSHHATAVKLLDQLRL